MFCKLCNTRLGDGDRACPNCGAVNPNAGKGGRAASEPRRSAAPSNAPEELDIELDEVLEQAGVESRSAPEPRAEVAAAKPPQTGMPSFDLDPAGVRKQLAEQPDLLEPGLRTFTNDKGSPVGAGYSTAVGRIDLLARDDSGQLVVVMVAERDQGAEIVAEMLQRIGWVRKHLARKSEQLRGIVLVHEPPENLDYAAAAVADTIAFKRYRVALSFDEVAF